MPPGEAGLAVDGGGAADDVDVLIVGASQPATLDRPAERSLVDFYRRRRRGIIAIVPAAAQPTRFGAVV